MGSSTDVITIVLFDGENIKFDASLFMYINITSIPPTMIMNRIYENQNLNQPKKSAVTDGILHTFVLLYDNGMSHLKLILSS